MSADKPTAEPRQPSPVADGIHNPKNPVPAEPRLVPIPTDDDVALVPAEDVRPEDDVAPSSDLPGGDADEQPEPAQTVEEGAAPPEPSA